MHNVVRGGFAHAAIFASRCEKGKRNSHRDDASHLSAANGRVTRLGADFGTSHFELMMSDEAELRREALRRFMDERGLKVYPWAKKAGISEGSIRNFLTGASSSLSADTLKKLARVAGVPVWALTGEEGGVPLVGYVGAGAEVLLVEGGETSELERVEAPPDADGTDIVAVRVKGDSMLPAIQDGWILYYQRSADGVPDDSLGKMCVVCTSDGRMFVKFLRRGYVPHRYNLLNATGSFREDVELLWASRVIWIRPN